MVIGRSCWIAKVTGLRYIRSERINRYCLRNYEGETDELVSQSSKELRGIQRASQAPWWLLIAFIPLIGAIVLLVFMFLDSTSGTNEYGPDPKGAQD